MPFLSPKRKVSDAENKLRILFCLDKLGMATQEQLWPFMAKLELMEYIPFCMFVDELRSDGAIASGVHAMEGSLFLTAAGRQQLELFSGRMVHADKERITREAPEYAQHLSQRRLVRAAYELSQEGEFRAFGTVCEGDVPTLLLHVRSRDEKLIERFVNVFPSVAGQALAQMYLLPLASTGAPMPEVRTQEEALEAARNAQKDLEKARAAGMPEAYVRTLECTNFGANHMLEYATIGQNVFYSQTGEHPFEISLVAIDDLRMLGCPAEMFVCYMLRLYESSPFEKTYIACCANGRGRGYICPPEAHAEGGYEALMSIYTQCNGDRILDTMQELLEKSKNL